MTWSSARDICLRDGGELAKVADADTQAALASWLSGSRGYWLGAQERQLGIFQWEDGSLLGKLCS